MVTSVNNSLLDKTVSHQIGVQRFSTKLVQDTLASLREQEAKIVERIISRAGRSGNLTNARLDALLNDIRKANQELFQNVYDDLRSSLVDMSVKEANYQLSLFDKLLPDTLDLNTPSLSDLKALVTDDNYDGALLREWVDGIKQGNLTRIRNELRRGVSTEASTSDIISNIIGTEQAGYNDGILNVTRRSAENLIRTTVNGVSNKARNAFFNSNEDVFDEVIWVSVLDSRTSAICQDLDGEVFPVDSGPRPPAHINCRSSISPIIKSARELGIEDGDTNLPADAFDGKPPDIITYDDWLGQQTQATQNDVLGAKRAEMFRKGASVKTFVNDNGKILTLDELMGD